MKLAAVAGIRRETNEATAAENWRQTTKPRSKCLEIALCNFSILNGRVGTYRVSFTLGLPENVKVWKT